VNITLSELAALTGGTLVKGDPGSQSRERRR